MTWKRTITVKLNSPLDEGTVKALIDKFDDLNIYLGEEESGWWGERTPYGVPSNHLVENENGSYINAVDFTEGKIPANLHISKDKKTIQSDGRTAHDVVFELGSKNIKYDVEIDEYDKNLRRELEEDYLSYYKRTMELREETRKEQQK